MDFSIFLSYIWEKDKIEPVRLIENVWKTFLKKDAIVMNVVTFIPLKNIVSSSASISHRNPAHITCPSMIGGLYSTQQKKFLFYDLPKPNDYRLHIR